MSLIVPVLQDVLGYDCHDPLKNAIQYKLKSGDATDGETADTR